MPTLNDLINQTRRHLYSNMGVEGNRLAGNVAPTDTTIALQYSVGTLAQRGAIIAVGLEEMRVWQTSGDSLTQVERGVNGTTAASHSTGDYVEVMPRFSPFAVMQAINDDLDELCSPMNGLFKEPMPDIELTYNPAVSGYDLTGVTPSSVIAIQEIRYKIPGPTKHLPRLRRYEVTRDVPTADYPSGMALLLYESAFPGLPLHVRYRSTFTHFVNLTDDAQTVVGLPPEANNLPALGAACALMAGREVKRNFTESTPDPLQLELVLAGNVLQSYKGLMLLRQQRIQAAAAALLRRYGPPARVL